MSKDYEPNKSIRIAVEAFPYDIFNGEVGDSLRWACKLGYEKGEEDTFNLLSTTTEKEKLKRVIPYWKKAEKIRHFNERCVILDELHKRIIVTNDIPKGFYYLPLYELFKLPKEE